MFNLMHSCYIKLLIYVFPSLTGPKLVNSTLSQNCSSTPVQQLSILEWFLKDHVTLKTGIMTADNSALISLGKKRDLKMYGCFSQSLWCISQIILNICKVVCAFLKTLEQKSVTYSSYLSLKSKYLFQWTSVPSEWKVLVSLFTKQDSQNA